MDAANIITYSSENHQNSLDPSPVGRKMDQKIKVAAAHAAPVFMNKEATTRKVIRLIEQAGKDKIDLLVFPETFIPGYPVSSQYLRSKTTSGGSWVIEGVVTLSTNNAFISVLD